MIFTAAGRLPAMKAASAVREHGAGLTTTRTLEVQIMAKDQGSTTAAREAARGASHG